MFEILLATCLAGDPTDCGQSRVPVTGGLNACRTAGRAIVATMPSHVIVQSHACREAGIAPRGLAMSEIAPGVFVHKGQHAPDPSPENRGDLANISFIVGEDAVAVIDTGTQPAIGADLLTSIRAETDLPIRWVILTHMHPDHVLGARPLVEAGAVLVGHRKLAAALEARRDTYAEAMQRLGLTDVTRDDILIPTETVESNRTLDLGNRPLRLIAYPTAHTDNDLTILDVTSGTVFLGDLLFLDHTPALDGSLPGWLEVLNELRALPASRAVPGHGPVSVPWPSGSDDLLRYLTVLAKDTRSAIARGTPMLEAIGKIGEDERANWVLFDDFNPRNATTAFQELEWE